MIDNEGRNQLGSSFQRAKQLTFLDMLEEPEPDNMGVEMEDNLNRLLRLLLMQSLIMKRR